MKVATRSCSRVETSTRSSRASGDTRCDGIIEAIVPTLGSVRGSRPLSAAEESPVLTPVPDGAVKLLLSLATL